MQFTKQGRHECWNEWSGPVLNPGPSFLWEGEGRAYGYVLEVSHRVQGAVFCTLQCDTNVGGSLTCQQCLSAALQHCDSLCIFDVRYPTANTLASNENTYSKRQRYAQTLERESERMGMKMGQRGEQSPGKWSKTGHNRRNSWTMAARRFPADEIACRHPAGQ